MGLTGFSLSQKHGVDELIEIEERHGAGEESHRGLQIAALLDQRCVGVEPKPVSGGTPDTAIIPISTLMNETGIFLIRPPIS